MTSIDNNNLGINQFYTQREVNILEQFGLGGTNNIFDVNGDGKISITDLFYSNLGIGNNYFSNNPRPDISTNVKQNMFNAVGLAIYNSQQRMLPNASTPLNYMTTAINSLSNNGTNNLKIENNSKSSLYDNISMVISQTGEDKPVITTRILGNSIYLSVKSGDQTHTWLVPPESADEINNLINDPQPTPPVPPVEPPVEPPVVEDTPPAPPVEPPVVEDPESYKLQVTNMASTAGYDNTLFAYNSKTGEVDVVFDNAHKYEPGSTVDVDMEIENKDDVEFLLAANGWNNKMMRYKLGLVEQGKGHFEYQDGKIAYVNGDHVHELCPKVYSSEGVGQDGLDHTQEDGSVIGFEDLWGGGDKDFDDLVIDVKYV